MEWLSVIVVCLFLASAIHGWFSGNARLLAAQRQKLNSEIEQRMRECELEIRKRETKLKNQVAAAERELKTRIDYINDLRNSFAKGFLSGRKWLAAYIAEADRALDEQIASRLKHKRHPARKASEEVAAARAERRAYKDRVKFLEYQLKSYEEYFPILTDYREVILDEAVSLSATTDNMQALEDADPVLWFMPKSEYEQLTTVERNQRALDRYLSRQLTDFQIGRFYERYIGYLHEKDGWDVEYHGLKGFEDLGRDLVCRKGHEVLIIQVKCWSKQKVIHEKHIYQLLGTWQHYLMEASDRLFSPEVSAWFITTTSLSPIAKKAAKFLKINIKEGFQLDKSYPMIKCNINQETQEKIYHLPFDQQYDRARIIPALGECYVQSIAEAEELGFRRAWRHRITNTNTA
jgi:hypothetical protein